MHFGMPYHICSMAYFLFLVNHYWFKQLKNWFHLFLASVRTGSRVGMYNF